MIIPFERKHESFLTDESKMTGYCSSVSYPETDEQVAQIVRQMAAEGTNLTVQGGRTGICGGAVPLGGHVMNMARMNRFIGVETTEEGEILLTAEAGMNLEELRICIEKLNSPSILFFPPDPSESTATLGGMAATGAKGMSAHRYGDTVDYIHSMKVIDGRGEQLDVSGDSEYYRSEGILGIITHVRLRLLPAPSEIWAICLFFDTCRDACLFCEELLNYRLEGIAALEYLDRASIELIQGAKPLMAKIRDVPDISEQVNSMVYTEIHTDCEDNAYEIAETLMNLATRHNADPELAWAVSTPKEIKRLRTFRHAASEAAILMVEQACQEDSRIHRLGAEIFLKDEAMESVLDSCKHDMHTEGLAGCVFGHVACNQFQVSLFPKDFEEFTKGQALLERWALENRRKHGSVFNEHGIGKLRRDFFMKTVERKQLDELRAMKRIHDPAGIFNRETIITNSFLWE